MESRVTRILHRRGAPLATIDDALQTAAMRALQRPEGFDGLDGLVNWVVKVAWHEVQAEWRRHARLETGPVPERSGAPDPAEVIEDRLALATVADMLVSLSDPEREAILGGMDGGGDSSASLKMRRYRARKHLAALVARTTDSSPPSSPPVRSQTHLDPAKPTTSSVSGDATASPSSIATSRS